MKGELVIITIEKNVLDKVKALSFHSPLASVARDELVEAVLAATPVGLTALLGGPYDLLTDPTARIATLVASEARRLLDAQEKEVSNKRGYCASTYPFCVPEGTPFEEDHYDCNLIAGHRGDCDWVLPAKRAKIPGLVVTVLR